MPRRSPISPAGPIKTKPRRAASSASAPKKKHTPIKGAAPPQKPQHTPATTPETAEHQHTPTTDENTANHAEKQNNQAKTFDAREPMEREEGQFSLIDQGVAFFRQVLSDTNASPIDKARAAENLIRAGAKVDEMAGSGPARMPRSVLLAEIARLKRLI